MVPSPNSNYPSVTMDGETVTHSPVPSVPSPSLSSRQISSTLREQHTIVRERTIEARRSAIGRVAFWCSFITSFLQITVIVLIFALYSRSYAPEDMWRIPGVALVAYTLLLVPSNITLFYFYLNPPEYDAFNISMMPERPIGKFMFRVRKAADLALFVVMVFILLALFDEESLKKAPAIYWTSAAIFIFNAGIALLPWLALLLLICCLPCVIQLLRWMYPEENRGATEDAISRVPKFTYSTAPTNRAYGGATIDPEDASCVICLQEYADGVSIRVLSCNHHYHQTCADEWFRFQATCPLCVAPVTDQPHAGDNKV